MTDFSELIDEVEYYHSRQYDLTTAQEAGTIRESLFNARTALLSAILEVEKERDALKEAMRWRDPVTEKAPVIETDGSVNVVLARHVHAPECGSEYQTSCTIYFNAHPEEYLGWLPIPAVPERDVKC